MIEEFLPRLLNQLMTELGSAMDTGSIHPLSIYCSGDRLALARCLQEYVPLLVDFLWRHHQEHTCIWKSFLSSLMPITR
jgi:hypothetical protein